MNNITIAGNLGADPEVRFTSSGQKLTVLRVAARARRGKKDETIWWRVTIWGEQFDKMMPYFKKGNSIMVMGEMHKPELFVDKENKTHISLSITAYNLMFSPFGRSSGERRESYGENSEKKETYLDKKESPSLDDLFSQEIASGTKSTSSEGTGSLSEAFGLEEKINVNEEEVPFL